MLLPPVVASTADKRGDLAVRVGPVGLGNTNCKTETIDGLGGNQPTYKTPIDDFCQSNSHIILLTDGQANRWYG